MMELRMRSRRASGMRAARSRPMPDKEEQTTKRHAKSDLRKGRSASTAAGEFVREEMHHIRRGVHGARSTKQAIAIGLSKARRAGIPLKPPPEKFQLPPLIMSRKGSIWFKKSDEPLFWFLRKSLRSFDSAVTAEVTSSLDAVPPVTVSRDVVSIEGRSSSSGDMVAAPG